MATTPSANVFSRMMQSVMPRPGQSGALLFDKTNVTEFLRRWDIECDTFGLSAEEHCVNLPLYCAPDTQDLVEVLPGYLSHDWTLLKKDLKTLFS